MEETDAPRPEPSLLFWVARPQRFVRPTAFLTLNTQGERVYVCRLPDEPATEQVLVLDGPTKFQECHGKP